MISQIKMAPSSIVSLALGAFDLKQHDHSMTSNTARAIRKQSDPMHSNHSCGTLMSYGDHTAQRCFKSNAPIEKGQHVTETFALFLFSKLL